jgi:hypothetical protein
LQEKSKHLGAQVSLSSPGMHLPILRLLQEVRDKEDPLVSFLISHTF